MSKNWNQVFSVTKQLILKEVISEELRKRVHIEEDFVWLEMPAKVHERGGTCEFEPLEVKDENRLSSSTIAQSCIDYHSSEEEFPDSDCFPEILETVYVTQCVKSKIKPFKPKPKYPNLHWLKLSERGVFSREKLQFQREEGENDKSMSEQKYKLPKMKFDASTTAILEMTIKNRYLGEFNEMIGSGKNSVVFHATCSRNNCITMPFENAVKIYKISKDKKKNEIIYKQVQREYEHLNILMNHKTGRRTPSAVRAWKNVIVMSFGGQHRTVGPSIKDVPFEKDEQLYNDIIDYLDKYYNIAHLVHGNLSARTILYRCDGPYFIGWSKSVKTNHSMALTKLMRDCLFVTKFYKTRGVAVKSAIDLFKQITNQESIDDKILQVFQEKDLYEKYKTNPNRKETNPDKPATNNRFK